MNYTIVRSGREYLPSSRLSRVVRVCNAVLMTMVVALLASGGLPTLHAYQTHRKHMRISPDQQLLTTGLGLETSLCTRSATLRAAPDGQGA